MKVNSSHIKGGFCLNKAIITGVSRGLGKSIAKLCLESRIDVIGISRTQNESLMNLAETNNTSFKHIRCDLGKESDTQNLSEQLERIIIEDEEPENVYLINNAAVLQPINQAQQINANELSYHIHVNTIAPIVIMNRMLDISIRCNIPLIGVNITSGAADRAIYGWSAYCSTKASINMYTKTVALEQDELQTGNKVIAFNPSIMDTDMQKTIRSSSPEAFKDVDVFKNYKQNNLLQDSDIVAGVLFDLMTDKGRIENGNIYDVKDYF